MNIENWATDLILELDEKKVIRDNDDHSPLHENLPIANLPVLQSYYRSKAFTSTIGINPLIIATEPLLLVVTKLRKITDAPDPLSLQQHLCHEIKAFEHTTENTGYPSQIIVAAKYVLCALIDEIILTQPWGSECHWEKYLLLHYFNNDDDQPNNDRFFLILERTLQDPCANLDLLELFYISLRFGYEGKYRTMERGHFYLRNILDNLYQCIRQQRDEFPKSLLISMDLPKFRPSKRFFSVFIPPLWVTSSLLVTLILTTYIIFYIDLIKISTPVEHVLTKLEPKEN